MSRARRFLFHPFVDLFVGSMMVIAGITEIIREVMDAQAALGAHHAVALYGAMLMLKAASDLLEGVQKTDSVLTTVRRSSGNPPGTGEP